MTMTAEPIEQVSKHPNVQLHYLKLRRKGFPHVHAKRLAHGKWQGIGLKTDKTFMAGRQQQDEFDGNKRLRATAEAKARAAGVSPTGKFYCAGLAKERSDPEAWITGEADVRRICNERGYGCEGSVNVKQPEFETEDDSGPYRVADDIVNEEIDQRVGDEHITRRERDDMFETVQTELSGD